MGKILQKFRIIFYKSYYFFQKFQVNTFIESLAQLIFGRKRKPIFLEGFYFQTTKFKLSSLRCESHIDFRKQCVIMTQ